MNYFSEQALYNFAGREPRLFFGRDDAKDHADPPSSPSSPTKLFGANVIVADVEKPIVFHGVPSGIEVVSFTGRRAVIPSERIAQTVKKLQDGLLCEFFATYVINRCCSGSHVALPSYAGKPHRRTIHIKRKP